MVRLSRRAVGPAHYRPVRIGRQPSAAVRPVLGTLLLTVLPSGSRVGGRPLPVMGRGEQLGVPTHPPRRFRGGAPAGVQSACNAHLPTRPLGALVARAPLWGPIFSYELPVAAAHPPLPGGRGGGPRRLAPGEAAAPLSVRKRAREQARAIRCSALSEPMGPPRPGWPFFQMHTLVPLRSRPVSPYAPRGTATPAVLLVQRSSVRSAGVAACQID